LRGELIFPMPCRLGPVPGPRFFPDSLFSPITSYFPLLWRQSFFPAPAFACLSPARSRFYFQERPRARSLICCGVFRGVSSAPRIPRILIVPCHLVAVLRTPPRFFYFLITLLSAIVPAYPIPPPTARVLPSRGTTGADHDNRTTWLLTTPSCPFPD